MVIVGNVYCISENGNVLLYIYTIKTNNIVPEFCDDECKALKPKLAKVGLN
jgi:hypothetical protein